MCGGGTVPIAEHKDVIKGPNFQIMYSSHPVDRNRGFTGPSRRGGSSLICNPNWRLTNSFDLPLEAAGQKCKESHSPHDHLLLRQIIEENSALTL